MEQTKLNVLIPNEEDKKGKTTREKVKNTYTEELFLGICAPIGSMKDNVISSITKILKETYNYEIQILKLTDYIEKYKTQEYAQRAGKTEAYSKLVYKIDEGNAIRSKYNNKSVLVELAIKDIHNARISQTKTLEAIPKPEEYKSRRICFIFNSIKNIEELLLLRQIYTDNFYQFSIFSPQDERETNLREKDLSPSEIKNIVETDDYDNISYGQNVRGTFTEGDFFLRVSNENLDKLDDKIKRYLNLIFESSIVTPTADEIAMYAAKSAAGNSACLSRQVGAAITTKKGNLISTGWNDVPKFGGNLYTEGDMSDSRCITTGLCSNDAQKDILVESIVETLKSDIELSTIFNDEKGFVDLKKINLFTSKLRFSKIKDLIEFSRSVHAEMHAIITGSQLSGSKMVNGKLFCTTYPCHNCAKHIIAAGIKEVYYIEPYIKSLCLTLHNDAITEDENSKDKVRILIFDGVAPRKYLNFFTNFTERKDKSGRMIKKNFKTITPKVSKSLQALPTLEAQAIHSLEQCGLLKID
ncbi:anti-phage dCTP deaminase [Flavobacterium sp. XS2P24]|uniref:anti-phage dCTP deaminase n=1 Tax=Flavobacterium sp. XS2P24 TaxID=3041249 RepID=UPI0024A85E74|nr:anti-phage dCTP deaminase [Flavobacterium sp. XS2P24]MDI6050779.1 anti-phage dCTP deaminase [Flavobacterium sp. XS2P24]